MVHGDTCAIQEWKKITRTATKSQQWLVPGGERKEYETRRGKTGLSLHYSIVSMSHSHTHTHAYIGTKEYEKRRLQKDQWPSGYCKIISMNKLTTHI